MASFSDKLKEATKASYLRTAPAVATLSDEGIAAYSGEETVVWTPDDSGRYKTTEIFKDGQRYEDDNISYIDEFKNITIDPSQINLTQEDSSQYIPFEMFRSYDGIDLMSEELDMKIVIFYVNRYGDYGEASPINVRYSDKKIRFGFVVPKEATLVSGKLKLEIQVRGASPLGGKYVLKTKPNEDIEILESLHGDGNIIVDESWATNVLEEVKQAAIDAQAYAAQAKSSASQAENLNTQTETTVNNILGEVDTKIENASANIVENVKNEMAETYYTQDQTDKAIEDAIAGVDGLANFKSTYNSETGELTFYNGETIMNESPHVLMTNPTDEWSSNYKATIQEELVKPVADTLDQHITDSDTRITTIEEKLDGIGEKTVVQYVDDAVESVDVSGQLEAYAKSEDVYTKSETYNKEEINTKLDNISLDGYATEEYVGEQVTPITTAITSINQTLEGIDKSPRVTYDATYGDVELDDGSTAEYMFTLWKTENGERTPQDRFQILGGGGSSGSSVTLRIAYVDGYKTPLVSTVDDKIILKYEFSGEDSAGDTDLDGVASWKVGSRVVKTEDVSTGINEFDLTNYVNTGDNKVLLTITHATGAIATKAWTIKIVDLRLVKTFDDTRKYAANSAVNYTFTPYGGIEKVVHFILDGKEIGTKISLAASSGLSDSYAIPAHEHGTHLLEVYMTAVINDTEIKTESIFSDIIWYDENSDVSVIGCTQQEFTARQYEATNITYTVYDPSTETPNVTLKATYVNEDGEVVETYNSSLVLTSNTDVWSFKTDVIGEHTLTITCGETVKTLKATITELGIEVSPTTAGLEFDFNPVGYSNNDANRIWSDKNTGVSMTVSDNFDWTNGGYQMDDAGDQYFCIKAGTTATINYNLFADDAKTNGKEFKVIFKTANIKNRNTSFISCMDYGIGLDMKVESANIYSSNGSLYSPYCEEDIIEFEFNINKNTDIPMVMTYEDGVGNRPMIYTSDSSFWQTNETPITIGSSNCDVHIYRMKAYSTSLSDKDILNNFIADARSAEEMIARHKRNQIYKDGILDPEYLAEICPDLRIIMLDAPWFTNDKDNKIDDTNITMIYKNGDPILDNWTCTGARHRGQGTSSNEYGYASRNIDLVMDTDTSLFTLGDGITTASTITLTRNSVPTDYLNVKVNVASSENENNAQNARNYSEFNPFVRFARWKDSKVKDCMEFYNCVVFIRERNEDISTHREFQDTNWHFYSIGNVGDSKKTDDTRVNDKNDPKEHVVEITDYNVPLAEFPTGKDGICPVDEWKAGNTAYDLLYADYEYKDGEFKSFGSGSYEFRYEMKKITDEQRQANIDTWREMYKFVVTSSDEDFYAKLKEWFVVDSALYYYLFTERYCMPDNRAKNSFWHYGKVYISEAEAELLGDDAGGYIIDNEQAAIREGYRYDLTHGYDFDTSLGIDNTGKLILTYGKEDTDFYVDGDSTSGYIYRAAESTFFCRLRDLFASEMQAMFVDRENQNAWSASRLIKQWDDAQSQFPEELWRLDIQRKYLRTYQGISIDNSFPGEANPRFLTEMMNGRKKYQRRMFERNQELYMATKYFGKVATQDQIMMRFNNPVGAAVAPDFTLYITPYSDMYIGTSFGNVTPTNFRAKAGVEYTIPCSIESGTADITLIYGASFIQAIGDLSRCYVGDNDFSKASRLQSLTIGSDVEGYENSFMTKISLGNNKLLEYLDIRNVTGLNSVVDLSQCGNLIELHAENSGATGVIFANGGKVEKAYIPAVTSLTVKNLNYLEEFVIESYDKLQTLIVEYTPFLDTYEMVDISPILKVLRLIGVNWSLENTNILDRILGLRGIDNTGGEISTSVLSGYAYVPGIKQYDYYKYKEQWSDLEIEYGSMTPQFVVTFVNDDGTILDVQYVDMNTDAVDPITREENPIDIPTKESTVSTDYTFAGWDRTFTNVGNNITVKATYKETIRQYSVKYVQTFGNKTEVLQESTEDYGTYCFYEGDTPTYTAGESYNKFYLFNRWNKSGYVDGDKVITAVYDECYYSDDTYFAGKEFKKLSPVELYALSKLIENGKISILQDDTGFDYIGGTNMYAGDDYSFTMGHDYNYEDLEDKTYTFDGVFPRTFSGTTGDYYDTGIKLLDEDRDFVLAIDYEFDSTNTSGATLMDCYEEGTSDGFRLSYDSNPTINWHEKGQKCADASNREMLVIRHIAGDYGLYVYTSNLSGDAVQYYELSENINREMKTDFSLIFGCGRRSASVYNYYAKGTVHWAKLWYTDLGEQACTKLASYIHEDVNLKISGFYRQFLSSDSSTLVPISFVGSNVLYTKKSMNITSINDGGWASSYLNTWLNNRFYNGLPSQIKQLIKQVNVKSTSGKNVESTITSPCYIYIPAVSELVNSSPQNEKPYTNEVDGVPICIPYFKDAKDRIMYDYNEVATQYWTRSPKIGTSTSEYFWFIKDDGTPYEFKTPSTAMGVVVEFSI